MSVEYDENLEAIARLEGEEMPIPHGQAHPYDQCQVIIWSARGSLDNIEDKISFEKAIGQLRERLNELEKLTKMYMPRRW